MIVGHADKIRMQVRRISSDGKIYINSDSFLPLTLIGNQVSLFSEQSGGAAADGGQAAYKKYSGTVEALGAIHFADAKVRTGAKGIKPEELVRVACRTKHKGTGSTQRSRTRLGCWPGQDRTQQNTTQHNRTCT